MDLVAIMMDNVEMARAARQDCAVMARDGLLKLEDAVVAYRGLDGVMLDQSVNLSAAGALGGAWWGTLLGSIFGIAAGQPALILAGLVGGTAGGATSGRLSDAGISDEMMKEAGEAIRNDRAILFLKGETGAPDKVLEKLASYGGRVVMSSLPAEVDNKINEALKIGSR